MPLVNVMVATLLLCGFNTCTAALTFSRHYPTKVHIRAQTSRCSLTGYKLLFKLPVCLHKIHVALECSGVRAFPLACCRGTSLA